MTPGFAPAVRSIGLPAAAPAEASCPGHEIIRHPVKRVLILDARREHAFDEPVLVELRAMRQHVGDDGDADRSTGVARRVDQGGGLVGLGLRNAFV